MSQNTLEAKDILTLAELAKRLKVPRSWIYESTRNRGRFGGRPMPVLRCGKYVRFDWQAIVDWLRDGGADPGNNGDN